MELKASLDRPAVEQKVLEVVRGLMDDLGRSRALPALAPEASLERDLGLGSLERVELVSRLEAEFSIELPETVLAEAETPLQLVEAVLAGEAPALVRSATAPSVRPGALAPPAEAETLVDVLRLRAEAEPRRAHIFLQEENGGERIIRYGNLFQSALSVAGGLAERGVEPGETVALMLPTGAEFFSAFAGILLAGAVPVPLYPPFSMDRIQEYAGRQAGILASAEARLLITVSLGEALGRLLRSRAPRLRQVTTVAELTARGARAPKVSPGADEPAFIQYTSGSTGDPKGVLLTHRNLLANIRAIGQALAIRPDDAGVSWLPLYHDMGLIGCWLAPLYFGIPMGILSPLAFLSRPERWLWTIHSRRATLSPAPNFAYELCVRRINEAALEGLDLSCWRAALNGAEPVSPDTVERFTERFAPYGFRAEAMLPVYGLAESTVALSVPALGRPPRVEKILREPFESEGRAMEAPAAERSPLRFVSVGRPLPGHDIRIVDEAGRELPERREGKLEFRGPSTMPGYYRNPEATAAVLTPDGWVDSGDLAFRAGGEIFITGRAKDVIIRAGRNIYPQEVEEIVAEAEGIRRGGVVAFGVADPREGTEKMVVVAETREEREEEKQRISRSIIERVTGALGVPPDIVLLAPPRTVPKTSSGKLRRSACREAYLKGELVGQPKRGRWLVLHIVAVEMMLAARSLLTKAGRLAYGVYAVLLAVGMLVPFWLLALAIPSRRVLARAVRFGARAFLWLAGCRLRVDGLDRIGREGPFILVANHASYLDPLPLLAALPVDFAFVVKREAADWPIIGTFIRRLGHLPVERADPSQSVADAERLAAVLGQGRSLFFFPEGTFTRFTGLRPFKLGAFKLAASSGRAILPLALAGTRRLLRDGTWLPRRSALSVVVELPLYASSPAIQDMVRLRDQAAEAIARHAGEPRLDLVVAGPPPRS